MRSILAGLVVGFFASASFAADTAPSDWSITGNHLIATADLQATIAHQDDPEGMALGRRLVQLYRDRGYVSIEAHVIPDAHTIRIVEAPAKPSGPLADYLPSGQVLTLETLNLAAARMTPAARLDGQRVAIDVLPVDMSTGTVEVRTSTTPAADAKRAGGGIGYTSMGQRYSGPDVATLYGWANIGSGQQIDGSFSHGFADWNSDSKHGRYENANAAYRKASRYGLTSLQLSHIDYKTGGELAPLDLNGTVDRASIEQAYLLTRALTVLGRLSWTDNKQGFDLLGWNDRQQYGALFGGVRYQGAGWTADAGIEQGLGGSRSYNVAPLLGRFDSHYTAAIVNASGTHEIGRGWTVTGKAGGQIGPDGTPNSSAFYLGGPDRGRSYTTGYTATPSGAYLSFSLNTPTVNGLQGYAGIDGAKGRPVVGPDREAKSAFIGARFALGKYVTGDAGFARTLGRNDDPTASKSKFNLVLTASF